MVVWLPQSRPGEVFILTAISPGACSGLFEHLRRKLLSSDESAPKRGREGPVDPLRVTHGSGCNRSFRLRSLAVLHRQGAR